MKKAVFGLANSENQAKKITEELLSSGFAIEDISVLYPDPIANKSLIQEDGSKKGHLVTERHSKAPEGGVTGAATGGILGGSLGLLAGMGSLTIPGLGPFIAVGPILGALSGSAIGGGLGLLIGALIGSGIPEYEAKKYESGLIEGNILISVHTDNYDEISRAYQIMKKEGAQEISATREKAGSGY